MEVTNFGDELFSFEVHTDPSYDDNRHIIVRIQGNEFSAEQREHLGVVASGLIGFRESASVRNWAPFFDLGGSPDRILSRFADLVWRADRSTISHEGGVNMALVQYQFDMCFDYRLGLSNEGNLLSIRCPIDQTETFFWSVDGNERMVAEVPSRSFDRAVSDLLGWIDSSS